MRLTTSIPRQGTRTRYRRSLTWLMLRGQAVHPAIAQRFSALALLGQWSRLPNVARLALWHALVASICRRFTLWLLGHVARIACAPEIPGLGGPSVPPLLAG